MHAVSVQVKIDSSQGDFSKEVAPRGDRTESQSAGGLQEWHLDSGIRR